MSLSFLSSWFNRHTCWEAPEPTASFQGKTVIITGSNTGLGLESAIWVVRLGAARVILACRNLEKGKVAAEHIRTKTSCAADVLDVWQVDMSSYASVIAFAEKVRGDLSRLDALFANAGIMANTFHLSEGNNEESLNINVISTALFIFLLHPKLRETAERHGCHTNVTITGSELWELAKFKESKAAAPGQLFATMNDEKKSDMGDRYNVTKLLVVFVVRQIAELAPYESSHVVANTVSPGFCSTNLGERDFGGLPYTMFKKALARSGEQGARMLVRGASGGSETHGQYIRDCDVRELQGVAEGKEGAELQRRFWDELKAKLEDIRPGVTALV